MAKRISFNGGNSNSATTWNTIVFDSGMKDVTESDIPDSEGSAAVSDVFTAPNLTSDCVGCVMYLSDMSSIVETWTVHARLQEYDGVSAWVDKGTQVDVVRTNDRDRNDNHTLPFNGFNYAWTTLSAGYYRVKLWRTGGSIGHEYRESSASTNPAVIVCSDDNPTVPASGDDVSIFATVTQNADHTWGSETVTTETSDAGNTFCGFAVLVGHGGSIEPDDVADRTLSINGIMRFEDTGEFKAGASGSGITNKWTLKHVGAGSNYAYIYGKPTWVGAVYSDDTNHGTQREAFCTGTGTTGDPIILTETRTGWAVDDQLVFEPEARGEHEIKYIRTVNSSTSFVLASTKGGAESGLSNQRTTGKTKAINVEMNVVFDCNGNSVGTYFESDNWATGTSVRMSGIEQIGGFMNKYSDNAFYTDTNPHSDWIWDNFFLKNGTQGNMYLGTKNATWNYITSYGAQGTSNASEGGIQLQGSGTTYTGLRVMGCTRQGIYTSSSYKSTTTDFRLLGNNTSQTNTSTSFRCTAGGGNRWNAGYIDDDTDDAIIYYSGSNFLDVWTNCTFGDINTSPNFLALNGETFNEVVFVDCTLNYTAGNFWETGDDIIYGIEGSYIGLHYCTTPDFTSDEETIIYTINGNVSRSGKDSTGADLKNSSVRTAGNNPLLIEPTNGKFVEFLIEQRKYEAVNFNGFVITENFAAGNSAKIELFKYGSTVADDSIEWTGTEVNGTPATTADWTSFSLTASNTDASDRVAKIVVTVNSEETDARFFLGDMYNSQDTLSPVPGGRVYHQAKISPLIYNQIASEDSIALKVWDIATADASGAGTFGEHVGGILATKGDVWAS